MLPGMAATMLTASLAAPNPVRAQDRSVALDIPAGDLDTALKRIAAATGRQIVFRGDAVREKRSAAVHGHFTAEAAVAVAVTGSGLQASRTPHGVIVVAPAGRSDGADPALDHGERDIVVTATKREERLQDIAGSIAAETGQTLRRRGATQLQDIVDATPGLSNPSSGGGNSTNLTIRGVTTGTDLGLKQSTVALLLDDIPVDPLGQGGGASNLRLVDIQRVEVLRGPQGTLFGSGSLAGAVRYITNRPDFDHLGGAGEATIAGTKTGAISYSTTAMLNVPLVTDKLAIRAVGYGYRDGGWVDNLRNGRDDANSTISKGGRLALAAKPVENLTLTLNGFYQDSIDHNSQGSLYVKPASTGHAGQVTNGIYNADPHNKVTIANFGIQYDFDAFSLLSSSTYQNRKYSANGIDYYFAPLTALIATGATVDGQTKDVFFADQKNFTQEIRLTSRNGGPFKWTIGGYYLHARMLSSQEAMSNIVVPIIGSDNIVDLTAPYRQREIAGFGEFTYTLFGKLDLTAGVRVSDARIRATVTTGGYITVFSILPSAYSRTALNEHDSPVTPRVSITWRASPDLSLYAVAARGYRVGGINETSGVGGRASPPSYGPDSLWNYETGAKGRAFGGKLTFAADVYYINWTNLQVSLASTLGNYTGNVGSARLYGLEAQFDARPSPAIAFGAAFSLSSNQIRRGGTNLVTAFGTVDAMPGDTLPASPEAQASGYVEVDFTAFGHAAYLRLGGHYLGPEYSSYARTGTRFGDFATANLRAGITLDRIDLVGFVNNLFDGTGATGGANASLIGPVILQNQTAYRVRPRTIGMTARASF
jgi:iron complex outermembrane receptor protein